MDLFSQSLFETALSLTLLLLLISCHPIKATADPPQESSSGRLHSPAVSVESLFGQVAKTVVYGGASLARFNSGLLCGLLTHESERDNQDQPTLYVFNGQRDREHAYRIYADDEITPTMVKEAQFDSSQMTIIYVHGWLGGIHNEIWLSEAKNNALRASDRSKLKQSGSSSSGDSDFSPNVIIVDWSEFAKGSLYTATENSFKVAKRLARLLEALSEVAGLRPELMHCLGHSIGTHICGQAARQAFPPGQVRHGKRSWRPRFGRITGLDPGGFCYELGIKNETTYLGLKPSDALLVDAFYSNRSPFGNKFQVAHYNVRVNNGFFQRPCSVWRNPAVATEYFRAAVRFSIGNIGHNDILSCDHYFATRFAYQPLPSTCSYVAYTCDTYRNFLRGRCGLCEKRSQCYSMDFEYQRSNASNAHALDHLSRHSASLLQKSEANGNDNEDDFNQPPGGVPYDQRPIYYMKVSNDEPYCSLTYRVRVYLAEDVVDVRNFRAEWLKLHFLGPEQEILHLRDGASNKKAERINLWGPWASNEEEGYQLLQTTGADERTLTALFELLPNQNDPYASATIADVVVDYDNELSRRQDPLANPIELIQIDYLSSTNHKIRAQHSRRFSREQFTVVYKHLGGLAAAVAAK